MLAAEPPVFPADGHERELAEAARRHPRLMLYAVGWLNTFPIAAVLETTRTLKGADAEEALDDLIHKTIRQMEAQPGGPEAAAALRRLAVCRGGFTLEAAKALIGDEAAALGPLMRWRLVTSDGRRYTIDPLVIEAVGEDETAHRPHYEFYKALAWEHDKKQDYLGLDPESANLEAAFEWAMRAEQYADAYRLYAAVQFFLPNRGLLAQRKNWLERAATQILPPPNATAPPADPDLVAAVQNSLGILYAQHPLGDRRANLRHAVAAYESALVYRTPEAAPLDYAATQNNLGSAYSNLASLEDRAANLRRAIAVYESALVYWTPEAAPLDYAMTQNNLGIAYGDLSTVEDRAANLRRAIAAFEAALVYCTAEAAPLYYAGTQNNLGEAHRNLAAVEDRAANLRRAIAAYEATLVYWTPEAAPLDYAGTQNNLGLAYADLAAVEDQATNLRRAVAGYEAALVYRTPEAAPLEYAATQSNLGTGYGYLAAVEDRAANLSRAIAAFEAALVYQTPEAAPLDFARTQGNLGFALGESGDLAGALVCWRRAEAVFRRMGYIEYADTVAGWIKDAEDALSGSGDGEAEG
ncbi:MAG: tetratricopeptide repeat protein [Anaerolineae bacterium]|nr:tetratricopeptide repeat protein [Anaerolineae bacterium]